MIGPLNRRHQGLRPVWAGLIALGILLVFHVRGDNKNSGPWELLKQLLLISGVSGHETRVADFIQAALPSSVKVQRDEKSNLWFSAGQGGPSLLFVAHMDELGLVVAKIIQEGTLRVEARGGFLAQMYEGHPVVVQTAKGHVEGVVGVRPGYLEAANASGFLKTEELEIYLGASSEMEARGLGIKEGDAITIKKTLLELGPDLLTCRAVDDRAGCAALLSAAQSFDWSTVRGKTVTFAWDGEEETSFGGARRLALDFKPDFVFSIDTFVSTDSPLESKRFAFTPLGKGPVVRAIDNGSIAPPEWVKRVEKIGAAHAIPLQVGNTRGSNDGSVFVPGGAVNIALSWPGVYSHSFIEKIDRNDLEKLAELIKAVIQDW